MPGSYFVGRAQSVGVGLHPAVALARFDGDVIIERLEVLSTTPNQAFRFALTTERSGSWGLLFDWDTDIARTPIGTLFSGGPRAQCAISFGTVLLPAPPVFLDGGRYLLTDTPMHLAEGQIFVLQGSLAASQIQLLARVQDV